MHIAECIEDANGDILEYIEVCSDSCHRDYCNRVGIVYGGWNGCHESDINTYCAQCGVRIAVDTESDCDGTCIPFVVNIIYPDSTVVCEHGIPQAIAPEWMREESSEHCSTCGQNDNCGECTHD